MDEREKLQERYDDAAFALMMDECAELGGEAFLAEFRAAAEAGDLPEIPADMDRLFRDTIKREFAARERKVRFRQFKRAAARVAVAVFAVIGVLSTLVMTVDAIRLPVMNFLIEYYEKYATINGNDASAKSMEDGGSVYLLGLLPEGYMITSQNLAPKVQITVYNNEAGDIVQFCVNQTDGSFGYSFDTEDAICSEVIVGDYKALLIEEEGYQVIWYDEESCTVYNLRATGFDRDAFFKICNSLASFYQQKD